MSLLTARSTAWNARGVKLVGGFLVERCIVVLVVVLIAVAEAETMAVRGLVAWISRKANLGDWVTSALVVVETSDARVVDVAATGKRELGRLSSTFSYAAWVGRRDCYSAVLCTIAIVAE